MPSVVGRPCLEVRGEVAVMDLNCQGWGPHPEKGAPGQPGSCGRLLGVRALLGSWSQGAVLPGPLLSLQVLGLTFAMTMYCQVVKADTYCA